MKDSIKQLQEDYNNKEILKQTKKREYYILKKDILTLEAEQMMLQGRWNDLMRKQNEMSIQTKMESRR